jgi:hypothetical protein
MKDLGARTVLTHTRAPEIDARFSGAAGTLCSEAEQLLQSVNCGDTVVFAFSGLSSPTELSISPSQRLPPDELDALFSAVRNRGANLVAVLDGCDTEAIWRTAGVDVWRAGTSASRLRPLGSDVGAFAAVMWRGNAIEHSDGGLLTRAFASAVRASPADRIGAILERTVASVQREGAELRVVAVASDEDLVPFGIASTAHTNDYQVELFEPASRGIVLLPHRELRVRGRIQPARGGETVIVGGKVAKPSATGEFDILAELRVGRQRLPLTVVGRYGSATVDIEVDVAPPAAVAEDGRRWALLIGNATYPTETGFATLATPISDVEEIDRLLRKQYGFMTEIPAEAGTRPISLVLRDAKKKETGRAFTALSRALGPGDSVLVYYGGHGTREKETNLSHWIPVDAENGDPSTWISSSELKDWLRRLDKARHVLVVSDSCFAGTMVTRGDPVRPAAAMPESDRQRYVADLLRRASRDLLASGSNEPVADSDTRGAGSAHSVFARAFIDELSHADLRFLPASELAVAIKPRVNLGSATGQMPDLIRMHELGGEGGEFVFVRTPLP